MKIPAGFGIRFSYHRTLSMKEWPPTDRLPFASGSGFPSGGGDVLIALLLSAFLFFLYFLTLAPGIVAEGDGAEFAACVRINGIPHKPGYPAYLLLAKIISLFPVKFSLIYRMNLMSAFFGAGTAGVLFLVIRQLGCRRFAAAFSVLFFALGTIFWTQAIITEVYAPLAFSIATGLLLLFGWARTGKPACLVLLALWIGLGLGIHKTWLVFMPLFAVYAIAKNYRILRNGKLLAAIAVFFITGSGVYLYLPFLAQKKPLINIENPDTVSKTIRQLAFNPIPSAAAEAVPGKKSDLWGKMKSYGNYWQVQYPLVATVLGLLGLLLSLGGKDNLPEHLLLLAIFLVASLGFLLRFDFTPGGSRAHEFRVMYIPSYLIFTVWMAAAGDRLLCLLQNRGLPAGLENRFSPLLSFERLAGILLGGLLIALYVPSQAGKVDKSRNYFFYDFGKNMFAATPPGSIIMTTGDNSIFPLLYLQMVEGMRRDTAVVHLPMLGVDWYRDMVRRAYPHLVIDGDTSTFRTFIKKNMDKRAIFVTLPFLISRHDPDFRMIPVGVVQQIVRRGHQPDPLHYVVPRHLRGIYDQTIAKDLREKSFLNVYPLAQYYRGNMCFAQKRLEAAINAYCLGLRYPPLGTLMNRDTRLLLYMNKGVACFYKKQYGRAEKAWQQALRIDPDNRRVRKYMNLLQRTNG